MKKIRLITAAACIIAAMAGMSCSKKDSARQGNSDGSVKIVTTVFSQYDWVRNIAGEDNDKIELTVLGDGGADLHSYQPSVQDIAKISGADIFIYTGGLSDKWVVKVIENPVNESLTAINTMEVIGDRAKEEEIVEGMQAEEEEETEEEDETEYDEHVWLSVRNAKIICTKIAEVLCEKDAAGAETYQKNLTSYLAELDELDRAYSEAAASAGKKVLLFADRFPFRYLTDDYNLKYYAAFAGCSAETEASFETIAFLARKVSELQLNCVLKIETGTDKIAKTVISSSSRKNVQILTLNSMQSVKTDEIQKGNDYISIMKANLEVFKEALE